MLNVMALLNKILNKIVLVENPVTVAKLQSGWNADADGILAVTGATTAASGGWLQISINGHLFYQETTAAGKDISVCAPFSKGSNIILRAQTVNIKNITCKTFGVGGVLTNLINLIFSHREEVGVC